MSTRDTQLAERYLRTRELVSQNKVASVPPAQLRAYLDLTRHVKRAETGRYFTGHVYVTRNADPGMVQLLSLSNLNSDYTLSIQ